MEKIRKNNTIYLSLSVLMMFFCILSIFFTTKSSEFLIVSALFFGVLCVLFDYQKTFGLLLFLSSFQIFEISVINLSFFNFASSIFVLIFFIKYIIDLIYKKRNMYTRPAIISIVLCLYSFMNFDIAKEYYIVANIVLIVLIYLTFVHARDLNVISLCKYYLLGVILSAVVGIIFCVFPSLRNFVMMENRFCGLNENPNTLQILCVISLSIVLTLFFKNYFSKSYMLFFVAFFVFVGVLTLSKAFIVCVSVLILVYFVLMTKRNKKQALIEFPIFVVLSIVVIYIFFDKFISIFSRFFAYGDDNILDSILTGRFSLWKNYLKYWLSNWAYFIFGCGVSHKQPYELGPHSSYIYIIYTFGIVGTFLICLLVIEYLKASSKKVKFDFAKCIPLFMFLFLSAEEYLLSSMRTVFLLCILILRCTEMKHEKMILFEKNY